MEPEPVAESPRRKKCEALSENRSTTKGDRETGKLEAPFVSLLVGIVFSFAVLFFGYILAENITESKLWGFLIGFALSVFWGFARFFTVQPGDGSLRILYGIVGNVLEPGPYWEFWPVYTHKTQRVEEFEEKPDPEMDILSADNIVVKISVTVRVVVTNLTKYYVHVVTNPDHSIKELISAYLRMYVNSFPAKEIPQHRRLIGVWLEGDQEMVDRMVQENGNYPEHFNRKYDLPEILEHWGIDFSTVVVEGVKLPDEMVQETEEKDARMTEIEGQLERFKKMREELPDTISDEKIWQSIESSDGMRHIVQVDSDQGDFTTASAVEKTTTQRGFGTRT